MDAKIDQLLRQPGAWLRGGGPESDIVLSSRVRLARNLAGYPFVSRISEFDRKKIIQSVQETAKKILPPGSYYEFDMTELSETDRRCLLERQLVSREFVDDSEARSVLVDRNEDFSVMVVEEDHLRLQAMTGGFDFESVWKKINDLDDRFERELPLAFDEKLGYLTACPSNLGTGIRVSVMVHLPGLLQTNEMDRAFRALQKMNLAVRGIYGEGSNPLGDLFQISNQATLGMAEEELIQHLEGVIPRIVDYERKARALLLQTEKEPLLDRLFRGIGILRSARKIRAEEAMVHLSNVRLGAHLGLQDEISVEKINDLLLHIQPAHLKKIARQTLDEDSENGFRADYLRKRLAEKA